MHLSRYLLVYPSKSRPDRFMLYSTIRGSIVQISGASLRAAQAGTLAGPESDTLARLGMLVADLDEERKQMRGVIERANGRSRTFRGIVVLNLDCNLNCGYCYEEDFRGSHYMSAATAQLVVETLIRDHISQGKDVSLAFYGGEPLLSQQLICAISEPLQKAATEHGVSYSFNLVTNGTLLNRDTAEKLIPFGLKGAKFTLDGPREIHDSQRPYASGSGSFDTIVENVAAIWDIVPLQLGGNFRQENYRDFPRLLDHLISRGITGEKLTQVQFGPVTPKAGCSEYGSGCASPNEPWLVEAQLYLREQTLLKGFPTPKQGVSACIVEFDNNLVVNWDGSLYKCPAFMGWQGLSIGSLAEGVADYGVSHCIGNWKIDECLECPYLPLCFGGCRFLTLLQGKSMSDVDCRRDFFDASLEDLLQQDLDHPQRPAGAAAAKEKPDAPY
jgi:uncharacterized protein